MKQFILAALLIISFTVNAQELYVYTDPASNVPAKSLGLRLTNNLVHVNNTERYRFATTPEITLGLSKKFMVKADAVFSNMSGNTKWNGAGIYAKYRFYSNDEVHSHLRMAAFVRGSISNLQIRQPAIDLLLMNSGVETGFVVTQLVKRTAFSAAFSHLYAANNLNDNKFGYGNKGRNALGYSLSAGGLLLPKEYTSYNQTNLNLMLEALGQTNFNTGQTFIDLAPSIQFIIKSRMRVDIGYRFAVVNSLPRTSEQGALIRLEYNIFNVF